MLVRLGALVLLLRGAAPPEPAELVVDGACEDAAALQERLAAVLPSPTAALGSVRLHAERVDAGVHGRLSFDVDGVAHERELEAESCAALQEASALVIGLTVQSDGPPVVDDEPLVPPVDESAIEPASPIESTSPVEPAPRVVGLEDDEAVSDAAPSSAPSSTRELGWRLQLGGGVALGVLHLAHPLVTAGGALAGRRWAAGLDALYLPPLGADIVPGVRAVVQLAAASVHGCPVWRLAHDRLAVPVCAGVAVGQSFGRGEGEAIVGHRGRQTWVAALVGPRAQLRARWGGELWLTAELVVPLRRLNFVIDEVGAACCELPLGAMISMGGGWWSPRQRI